ncbi:MAG TPA: NPCBM/NEW2 domain-containing protein [Planctomycetota bacterium]|nr:NPCBM/NEW2 domain-containing protein [Planctomycetota bacterium]
MMSKTRSLALQAVVSWLGLSLAAQAPPAATAPVREGPTGRLRTIDGRTLAGRLTVDANGRATIVSGDTSVALGLDEVTTFERDDAVVAAVSAPHRVWLRSGLELPGVRLSGVPGAAGKPAMLTVELPCGRTVAVPFGTIRAVRHGGSERAEPRSFAADRESPPANEDLLYVQKDGQAVRSSVTIVGCTADQLEFTLRGRAIDFPFAAITGMVFGTNTGFAPDAQPMPRTTLELTTGEHLEGRLLEANATLRLRLDEGAVLDVPADKLFRLTVASDRLVWLSQLTPKVEQTAAFDRSWPWYVDRSVAGPGLVLGGKTYSHGLGLVPYTRLTYELGGKFDLFEAMIGIDDRGGPQAHAVFRVFVDGKLAFESAPMTLGKPAEAVQVELHKCSQLAIEVDFGKNYDLGDFCAFADARVVQR